MLAFYSLSVLVFYVWAIFMSTKNKVMLCIRFCSQLFSVSGILWSSLHVSRDVYFFLYPVTQQYPNLFKHSVIDGLFLSFRYSK